MTTSREALGESSTLVLCGGRGERMGSEYAERQKVLLDIGGISLLEQVVRGVVRDVDGGMSQREVALLTGHGTEDVHAEVKSWPGWLARRVVTVQEYHSGKDSLAELVADTSSPRTMVSGNVLLDYPNILSEVEERLRREPSTPVVVGSTVLRTSTHYAIDVVGSEVTALTRRAATPAAREVVDVFGLTDQVIGLADQNGMGCATAIARHIPELRPQYIEYNGPWAHFETPKDFENNLGGEYGNFDYR